MMKKVFDVNMTGVLVSLLMTAALLLFASAQARAQSSSGGGNAQGEVTQEATGEQNGNLADQLRLTPEQVGRIAAIREQTKEERRVVNQRVRQAQRALEEAIYADNANESLIEERARELSAAQAESLRLRTRSELNVRRVLTPEQLTTLRSIRERARARQQERRLMKQGSDQPPPPQPRPLRSPLERRRDALNQPLGRDSKNIGPADGSVKQGVGPRVGRRRGDFPRRPRL
jgi:Spy/CpxP family protein refolding chaperone